MVSFCLGSAGLSGASLRGALGDLGLGGTLGGDGVRLAGALFDELGVEDPWLCGALSLGVARLNVALADGLGVDAPWHGGALGHDGAHLGGALSFGVASLSSFLCLGGTLVMAHLYGRFNCMGYGLAA